jgi:hypothetical protein
MDQQTPLKRNREGVSLNPRAFRAQKEVTNNNPKKKVKFDFDGTTGNNDELQVNFFLTLSFFLTSLFLWCYSSYPVLFITIFPTFPYLFMYTFFILFLILFFYSL